MADFKLVCWSQLHVDMRLVVKWVKKVCQIKPLEERRKNICNNKPNQIALTQLNMVILKKLTKWLNIKLSSAQS